MKTYLIQTNKVTKPLIDRPYLNPLSIQLKLIESHVVVVDQCLTYIALDHFDLVVKVLFVYRR